MTVGWSFWPVMFLHFFYTFVISIVILSCQSTISICFLYIVNFGLDSPPINTSKEPKGRFGPFSHFRPLSENIPGIGLEPTKRMREIAIEGVTVEDRVHEPNSDLLQEMRKEMDELRNAIRGQTDRSLDRMVRTTDSPFITVVLECLVSSKFQLP